MISYCPSDLTGVGTLKYAAVGNTAFLFIWSKCVRGKFLCDALLISK